MPFDYIPKSWKAFAVWMANFNSQLPTVAEKYGIDAAAVLQTSKDNDWVQYWADFITAAKRQLQQLNNYADSIVRGNLNDPPPNLQPVWALPPSPPESVPPGIKKRIREIATAIKSQKSIYAAADGELLGIISPDETRPSEENFTPELKLLTLPDDGFEADFLKYGMKTIKIE